MQPSTHTLEGFKASNPGHTLLLIICEPQTPNPISPEGRSRKGASREEVYQPLRPSRKPVEAEQPGNIALLKTNVAPRHLPGLPDQYSLTCLEKKGHSNPQSFAAS